MKASFWLYLKVIFVSCQSQKSPMELLYWDHITKRAIFWHVHSPIRIFVTALDKDPISRSKNPCMTLKPYIVSTQKKWLSATIILNTHTIGLSWVVREILLGKDQFTQAYIYSPLSSLFPWSSTGVLNVFTIHHELVQEFWMKATLPFPTYNKFAADDFENVLAKIWKKFCKWKFDIELKIFWQMEKWLIMSHFSIYQIVFQKSSAAKASESVYMWKTVKMFMTTNRSYKYAISS